MIESQWYAILDGREIPKNKPIGVTRLGEKLVLWRDSAEKIHCIKDRCCHRGASLSKGHVHDDYLVCPFHGFEYDSNGKVYHIPAYGKYFTVPKNFKVEHYAVRELYGIIWIWYGPLQEVYPEIPFFKELREGYYYSTFSEVWKVHYTRAIENQLDVVHLPFVHHNTIGRGNKVLVNGPVVKWKENLMTFYVFNEEDRGQNPLKPSEISNYEKFFSLQFQMPNLWQNIISDHIRIVAFFSPIDDSHTKIYLRFYQNIVRMPLVRDIFVQFSKLANRIILHQDRRVVLTQQPIKSDLNMDEILIQGDLPIIEYRKRRHRLQNPEDD